MHIGLMMKHRRFRARNGGNNRGQVQLRQRIACPGDAPRFETAAEVVFEGVVNVSPLSLCWPSLSPSLAKSPEGGGRRAFLQEADALCLCCFCWWRC